MLSIKNEIDPCLLLPLCVLYEIQNQIFLHSMPPLLLMTLSYISSCLLLSCTNLKSLPQGQQLHAQIISLGLKQHPILLPKLVTFYSSFDLLEARTITANLSILHPLPWNLLISAYVRNGLFGEALHVYKEMVEKGIRPDNFTCPSVLKACAHVKDGEKEM